MVRHMADVGYEWQRVAAVIEAEIADGTLQPGAMLLGERAMAEQYGVAIGTVRRAVKDLRERGILVTLPHKGTYVAEH
jgi:DNA-binding GntR family transcriptional regulator